MRDEAPASSAEVRWSGALVAIAGGGALIFVASFVIAAALYPGGTWVQRTSSGHSFFGNYLCDLMQTRALNGRAAGVGAWVARSGALAMFAAVASFFIQVARLEARPSLRSRLVLGAGLSSCALGAAVPMVTSDQLRAAHVALVVAAFVPALVATIAAAQICLRSPATGRWIKAAALLTLSAGAIDGILYAFAYGAHGLEMPLPRGLRRAINDLLPLLQRIATLGLLAWVIAVSWRTAARRREVR